VLRISRKCPDDDRDREDGGARALEKHDRALPHPVQGHAQRGAPVRRHLQQQQRVLALEERLAEQPGHGKRGPEPEQVQPEHDAGPRPCRVSRGQQHRDQQRIDGQTRRTAHQRHHQRRDKAVLLIVDRARGHDARDRAGETAEHRHERFSVQAHLAHQPVHDERRARHVPGVLQQPEEEKQDQNLRQKDDHTAHARDDAVDHQIAKIALGQCTRSPAAHQLLGRFDPAHRKLREPEHREKHQRHHAEEKHPAPQAVGEHGIDAVARGGIGAVATLRRGGQLLRPRVARLHRRRQPVEPGGLQRTA